jgi:uncharacterized membrane protein YhaH (DUF805 family)
MGLRVGAGTYLLAMSAAVNLWALVMIGLYFHGLVPSLVGKTFVAYTHGILAALIGVLFFYLSRKRLQDLNCPANWAFILSIPVLGVVILPVLCFLSGPRYTNDFGDPPAPSGWLKVAAGLASFAVAPFLVLFVARLYAPLRLGEAF